MSEPRLTFALMSAMISGGEAELVEFEVCCIKYKKGAKFFWLSVTARATVLWILGAQLAQRGFVPIAKVEDRESERRGR